MVRPIHGGSLIVPPELKPYGVVGIFVGGCVKRGVGSSFRRKAHAHCDPKFTRHYQGWICIRSSKRIWADGTGDPSFLLWHEVAHIYRRSWTEAQCDRWARQQAKARILAQAEAVAQQEA